LYAIGASTSPISKGSLLVLDTVKKTVLPYGSPIYSSKSNFCNAQFQTITNEFLSYSVYYIAEDNSLMTINATDGFYLSDIQFNYGGSSQVYVHNMAFDKSTGNIIAISDVGQNTLIFGKINPVNSQVTLLSKHHLVELPALLLTIL